MGIKVILKDVRGTFLDVHEPVEFEAGDGKFRYNASAIVVPGSANDKAIQAAIIAAAKEEYGEKWEKTLAGYRGNSNKYCYMDGDLKDYEGYAGNMILATHRRQKDGPCGVYDNVGTYSEEKKRVVPNKLDSNSGRPYNGCYINLVCEIFAQSGTNGGIRAGLTSVQFVRDGDAFSGAKPASADDFEALDQGADADPLAA